MKVASKHTFARCPKLVSCHKSSNYQHAANINGSAHTY